VRDLVIVHVEGATLVCPVDRAEEVKELVEELKRRGLERPL
jgi:mannose-1-phosphate guanylyltransferase